MMLLYYQDKWWNPAAGPPGSRPPCGSQVLSFPAENAKLLLYYKECWTPQSKSFNTLLLSLKGVQRPHPDLYMTDLHHLSAPGSRVVVNDCFALSFLSTSDRLRDWSIQTGRVVVISAALPASPDEDGRISISCHWACKGEVRRRHW